MSQLSLPDSQPGDCSKPDMRRGVVQQHAVERKLRGLPAILTASCGRTCTAWLAVSLILAQSILVCPGSNAHRPPVEQEAAVLLLSWLSQFAPFTSCPVSFSLLRRPCCLFVTRSPTVGPGSSATQSLMLPPCLNLQCNCDLQHMRIYSVGADGCVVRHVWLQAQGGGCLLLQMSTIRKGSKRRSAGGVTIQRDDMVRWSVQKS